MLVQAWKPLLITDSFVSDVLYRGYISWGFHNAQGERKWSYNILSR